MGTICKNGEKLWQDYLNSGKNEDYDTYILHLQNCPNCFENERTITGEINPNG